MGVDLSNEPTKVQASHWREYGIDVRGELWAAMLDPKQTFDALIDRVAPSPQARDDVLSNRIYQHLSEAVAGLQEFTAIAKVYELSEEGDYDILVLDTPPSRHALDFLSAPSKLLRFFRGRALRLMIRPVGIGSRLLGGSTNMLGTVLNRLTGVDLLTDLSQFFSSLSTMIESFTARTKRVDELLRSPETGFVAVSSPANESVRETIFFGDKLRDSYASKLSGLIINRVRLSATETPEDIEQSLGDHIPAKLARKVATAAAAEQTLARRDEAAIALLTSTLDHPATVIIPELTDDIHDVDGLVQIESYLFQVKRRN